MKTPLPFKYLFYLIVILNSIVAFSQNKNKQSVKAEQWAIVPFERKAFIENKGQFNGSLPADKQSFQYAVDKGQQVFFYPDGITYRFTKRAKSKETFFNFFESEEKREARERILQTKVQYIHIKWLGCDPNATIVTEDKQSTYYSYTVKNNEGRTETVMCDGYSKLTYKNLYPGIDVEYIFHPENGLKYNLIVHAGADISKVKMQYDAESKVAIKNGNLYVTTIRGDIVDHAPVTFYADNKEKIASAFNLSNNQVSFNISSYSVNREVIVDPWTLVPGFAPSQAYDNGVDNAGNVYVYGGAQGAFIVEKYPAAGGAPIWSLANNGIDQSYYGDMLVENNGNFYLCEGFVAGGARTYKFSPTSTSLWQSGSEGNFREHWRLALNCITNKVIVAGGGTTSPTLNIAEIDVTTGALVNAKSVFNQSQSDVAGLCVDELGQAYLKHSNPNIVTFTDNQNNTLANVPDGYNLSEVGIGGTPSYYPANFTNGYNFMTLGGVSFLFTTDGATIKKWDRNTQALISSVVVPGGQQNLGSGILADKCNNLFIGASNGVYRYDFNLVQQEFQATPTAVYDIAYAINSDIVASGDGFLMTLPFGRASCGATNIQITSDPCDPEINTVKVTPTQGVPPFSFFWDDGSTDSLRTNLPLGNHIVSIKDGSCNPSFFTDTIKIEDSNNAISIQKTNPLCAGGSDGDISVTLLSNQQVTGVTWTPNVANSLINDSTSKATGLVSGTYNCFITSDLGCSFDTAITIVDQFPNPSADFPDLQACEDASIQFTDNSVAAAGGISTWSWNFGDNSAVSSTQNPSHTYTDSGTYTATLIITTTDGCKDTIQKDLFIHPLPEANFSFENVCEGSVAFLNNLSTITAPDIVQLWTWDFGDGSAFKNNQNTIHLYPATGPYNVELTVTSNFGCRDSLTKVLTVNPNPVISFTAPDTNGCSPLCVNLQSTVNLSSGSPASYLWDYGSLGATGTTADGYYCYSNTTSNSPSPIQQEFTVSLTVTSDSGCVKTVTKDDYILVYPNPIASFTVDPITVSIINPGIEFTNLSHGANSWNWNFGDLTDTAAFAPLPHTYVDTGTYTINLNIENQYGCQDSTYRVIVIEPDWAFFVPNSFTPNGDGINDSFRGQGYGLLDYHMAIFDRWGNKIYVTDNYDNPWDGRAHEGKDSAQMDVYIYQITVKDIKGLKHTYSGTVTLVR